LVQSVVLVVDPVHVFLVLGRDNVVGGRENLFTCEDISAIFAAAVSLPDSAGKAALNGISLFIRDRLDGFKAFMEWDCHGHLGPRAVPDFVH